MEKLKKLESGEMVVLQIRVLRRGRWLKYIVDFRDQSMPDKVADESKMYLLDMNTENVAADLAVEVTAEIYNKMKEVLQKVKLRRQ